MRLCMPLFAKITPNLRKIGLLDDHLTDRLVAIGAVAPDDLARVPPPGDDPAAS